MLAASGQSRMPLRLRLPNRAISRLGTVLLGCPQASAKEPHSLNKAEVLFFANLSPHRIHVECQRAKARRKHIRFQLGRFTILAGFFHSLRLAG
jgi:hypothetical protein